MILLPKGAVAAILCLAASAAPTCAAGTPSGSSEKQLLALVNRERVRRDLPELTWNDTLAALARAHAADMVSMGKTTHRSSRDGAGFTARLARSGLRANAAAENVAYAPDVERAHRGLMESPGHRRNILDPKLTAIGIGIARGEKGIYVTEDFATPIADLSESEAIAAVRRGLAEARRRAGVPSLVERISLSERLAAHLKKLIEADSVDVDTSLVPGPAWVIAYTSSEPDRLPEEVGRRLREADGFAVAAGFGRTRRYPFGTYWVILALTGEM